jgi:predicted transcriptional regulator
MLMSTMVDLVQIRRLQGLNQPRMAEKAGLSVSMIVRAEGGKLPSDCYPSTLKKLADAYGVTTAAIQELCTVAAPEKEMVE